MRDYSRRKFLQGSAVLSIAGLAGLSAACSPVPPSENNSSDAGGTEAKDDSKPAKASGPFKGYTPGVYTAKVSGHNAPFEVKARFTQYALSDIDASPNLESLGVGKTAVQKLSHDIIANQSLKVDAITGATVSSAALLKAVKEAAEQAGGASQLEAEEPVKPELEKSYDTDVLVIGGGGAGLTAAIRANQEGAKVIILEKCGFLGGSTNVSEGALNAVDPERQEPQGIKDSVQTFYDATIKGGHEKGNPELVDFLTKNALDSVHWLESLGVNFDDKIGAATGSLGQRSHYPKTPYGNTYTRSFENYLKEHQDSMQVIFDAQVTELLLDGSGAVTGAKAKVKGDTEISVNAKATVIATGGFGANVEYRQKVNDGVWKDVVLDSNIGCTNVFQCAQGDGLKLAENTKAALIDLSDIQLHPCGTPGTGLMEDIRTSGRNRIFVNKEGARFVNEGAARDTLCKAIFDQPDSTYWIVVNKLRYPTPTTPDKNGATIENMLAQEHIVAGETLDELAEKTGMNPETLKASIDQYNAIIDGSQPDPLGFKADNTADAQMTEGPWYANRKVPTVHHTMGGIKVNVKSEAVDESGNPIPGLYACGECTGGIHGSNRLGGNAIADCITFGINAGINAANRSKN